MVPVGFTKIKININIIAAKEVIHTFLVTSSEVMAIFFIEYINIFKDILKYLNTFLSIFL